MPLYAAKRFFLVDEDGVQCHIFLVYLIRIYASGNVVSSTQHHMKLASSLSNSDWENDYIPWIARIFFEKWYQCFWFINPRQVRQVLAYWNQIREHSFIWATIMVSRWMEDLVMIFRILNTMDSYLKSDFNTLMMEHNVCIDLPRISFHEV